MNLLPILRAEFLKLRRAPVQFLLWLIPFAYLVMDYRVFGRFVLWRGGAGMLGATPLALLPLKSLGLLWAGLFHPLLLALIPPLLMQMEHRPKMWRHLHVLPVSRRGLYLGKVIVLLALHVACLALVVLGLRLEWGLIGWIRPQAGFPFPWLPLLKVMGMLFLGSLPVQALYLWISDRITAAAVPVFVGLMGLLLTIALTGQDLVEQWRRDLVPWVLPYACAQRAIEQHEAQQQVHLAAVPFQKARPRLRVYTWEELGLPAPIPTPTWLLWTASLVGGMALVGLGARDASRNRE